MFVRLSDKTGQGKGMVRAWLPNMKPFFQILTGIFTKMKA